MFYPMLATTQVNHDAASFPIWLIFLLSGLPFMIAGFAVLMLKLFTTLSGWPQVADRFFFPSPFEGELFKRQPCTFNSVRFKNSITFGINASGLYISTCKMLSLFQKPMLIPWNELHYVSSRKGFFSVFHIFTLHFAPHVRISIPETIFRKMERHLPKTE